MLWELRFKSYDQLTKNAGEEKMQLFIRQSQVLISSLALLLISQCAFAYTAPVEPYSDPMSIIKTTLQQVTAFSSNSDNVSPTQLRHFIENKVIPHFDFDNMSHWITGHHARNMTPEDKSDFQRSLRETFLSSLATHLGSFDAKNTRFRFYPVRYRGPEEAFVNTTVYRPDRLNVNLDFRMRRSGNDWKIIDIKANGSSAVLYYRRHFMSQLRDYRRAY